LHVATPFGRPDVVFQRARLAVFIDGCFWHGCPPHYVRPRSNASFWADKLSTNVERDRRQTIGLEESGWRVLRFWEHEVFEALEESVRTVRLVLNDETPGRTDWRVIRVEEIQTTPTVERRHLVSLRNPALRSAVEGPRVAKKWRRPG
jgi:DNA mismatch endonuclease (patch repair protein)